MNRKHKILPAEKAIQRDLEADAAPFGIGAYKKCLCREKLLYDVLATPDTSIWY